MPLVSIIVPNYNHARYLPRRLDSITNQTFEDFEVVFLDDASTDNSLPVFEAYAADPRIRPIFNDRNSGSPFKQWNRGMSEASGKYIWIAESDDFCSDKFLQKLVPLLEEDPSLGLVFCQSNFVDQDDRVNGTFTYGQFSDSVRWKHDFAADGPTELRRYFSIANVIPNASAVVFRSDLVKSGLSAPEDMRLAGDWMFWVRLLCRSNLSYVAEPLNYFREVHQESQRFRSASAGLEILEGLQIFDFIDQSVGMSKSEKIRALGMKIRHWMFVRRQGKLDRRTNRQILSRLQQLATGVYGRGFFAVRLNILLRAGVYWTIQLPLLKRSLGRVWSFYQNRYRKRTH